MMLVFPCYINLVLIAQCIKAPRKGIRGIAGTGIMHEWLHCDHSCEPCKATSATIYLMYHSPGGYK